MPYGGLLERDTELDALHALINSARAGTSGVLLAEGHPGLGKTSLVAAALNHCAAAGLTALRAAGGELERDLGWGVVRDLFSGELADRERRRAVLRDAASAAAPLFGEGERPAGPDAAAAIMHGLYWLVCDLAAAGPLVIVVDDLHWADSASARWLAYLAARVEDLPVALLLTARPEPSSPHWQAIAAAPTTRVLTLTPLSQAGTRALLARELGESRDDIADACHRATGGNPFLLGELLSAIGAGGGSLTTPEQILALRPESLRRGVLLRLAQLGEAATTLCFALAVLDQRATLALAAELAELDPGDAARAADALVRADVIRTTPRLQFAHPLVLAVIEAEIPNAQRLEWHRRAAALLVARGYGPGEIAPHLLATEPDGRADVVATLRTAAADAFALGAPETAAACLRRALAEPPGEVPRIDVLFELGQVEGVLADPAGSARLREALMLCSDPVKRGQITLALVGQLLFLGVIAESVALCDAAALDLDDGERELRLELFAQALVVASQDPAVVAADRPGLEPGRLKGATRGERMLLAAHTTAAVTGVNPLEELNEIATRALGDGALLADVTADGASFWAAQLALLFGERYAEAARHIDEAVEDSRRRGSPRGFGFCLCFGSALRYRIGELEPAIEDASRALDLFAEEPLMIAYVLETLLAALIDRGALSEARAALAAFPLDAMPPIAAVAMVRVQRGRVRLIDGDIAGAVDDLLTSHGQLGAAAPVVLPWRADVALALHAAREHDRAVALAREEVERGEIVGSRWVQAYALHALAQIEDSAEPLERAEQLTRDWPTKLERARVVIALGTRLRRAGDNDAAIAFLREGLDLADRCGAIPLAREAGDALRTAGARPRRARISGRDALTPSELRVCEMAADGLSNRQIAAALFVSLRTVETHLTHAYTKLGVSGREALAVALRTHGDVL